MPVERLFLRIRGVPPETVGRPLLARVGFAPGSDDDGHDGPMPPTNLKVKTISIQEIQMREFTVKDFVDFISQSNNFDLVAEVVIFRGQPTRGQLIPTIARKNPKTDTSQLEKKILSQLALMSASLLPYTFTQPCRPASNSPTFWIKDTSPGLDK